MSVAFLLGETFDGLKKKCKKETFVAESNSQNREVFFPPFSELMRLCGFCIFAFYYKEEI